MVDKQREALSQTDKATAMQREYAGKHALLDSREKDLDRRERAMETEKAHHIEMKAQIGMSKFDMLKWCSGVVLPC